MSFPKYILLFYGFVYLCSCAHEDPRGRKMEAMLEEVFEDDPKTTRDVIVEFKTSPTTILNTLNVDAFNTEEDMCRAFKRDLKLLRTESQLEVHSFLSGTSNKWKSFWLTNSIFIQNASLDLIESMGSFENVARVREAEVWQIHKPLDEGPVEERPMNLSINNDGASIQATGWNIAKVRATEIWSQTDGAGVTVGLIDTGIRATHECFGGKNKVVAWMDAVHGKSSPYDDNGHGSHCGGTIAGSAACGIGVAPGVKLVVCKACDAGGSCSESDLTACCQFIVDKRPDIVSNSWGGSGGSSTYVEVINSMKAMGIIPVFSAGNSGPQCSTIGSPGDYPTVISVGSTTSADALSDFSSRGTCKSGVVGPTVTAPGSNIRSIWKDSDTSYKSISGTSMAAPHVSGAIALLKAINPGMTFDQVKASLTSSCVKSGLADPKQTCGGTSASHNPNNMFGNGRIDVANAVQLVQAQMKRVNSK